MVSGTLLLSALLYVVIGGLIFSVLWWGLRYVSLPAPFDRVARVILVILAVIFLVSLLLGLSGHPVIRW